MKKIIRLSVLFILFSISSYSQWQSVPGISPVWIISLASNGNNIFAGNFILTSDEKDDSGLGVWFSTNSGLNWNLTSLGVASRCLHFRGSRLFSCSGTLYYSDNNGTNWINPIYNSSILVVGSNSSYVFCGGYNGLYISSNNGTNWTTLNSFSTTSLLVKDSYLFTADQTDLRISSNNGINWTSSSIDGKTIYTFATDGTNIFAGTSAGLYKSSNNGANWIQSSLNTNAHISSILVANSGIIASSNNSYGIFKSTNAGLNWVTRNEGLNYYLSFDALLNANGYVYAGGTGGLFKRSLQEILSVNQLSNLIPGDFNLSQNFPNPFNPSTIIKFKIKEFSFTTLKIFDALGREVQTLVNEKLKPGEYETTFDGSLLPSGIYFYTLASGDFKQTKSALLIK